MTTARATTSREPQLLAALDAEDEDENEGNH
jgi:hypothetical protein